MSEDLDSRVAALEAQLFGMVEPQSENPHEAPNEFDEEPMVLFPGGDEFEPLGEKALYKVVALREYNTAGELIPVGREDGGDGRVLLPTWDWVRAHEQESS